MNKIACIVVTYNRLTLLKQCVESLKNQTFKEFDIIVVNNGSDDGTREWLADNECVIPVCQDNVGGAGGFYAGMKLAFDNGYEWVWMMDDDGIADNNQLSELLAKSISNNLVFSNALVCNIDTPNQLSFGLSINGIVIFDKNKIQKQELQNAINPFNGTFIHRTVIEKIGFIKKEMFIWGDETEYTFRAKANGFNPATITTAIHYHPQIKGKTFNVVPFWTKYNINVKPKGLSYIYYRNLGYIYKNYIPNKSYAPVVLYTILFVRLFRFTELFKFWKYYRLGLKGIF